MATKMLIQRKLKKKRAKDEKCLVISTIIQNLYVCSLRLCCTYFAHAAHVHWFLNE